MLVARGRTALIIVSLLALVATAVTGCGRTEEAGSKDDTFTEYEVPSPTAGLTAVAVDAKGRVWFTQAAVDRIGMLDPESKKITDYTLPTRGSDLSDIAIGADGRVWFTAPMLGAVGYLEPATKAITERRLSRAGAAPTSLFVTGDAVWEAERSTDMAARLAIQGDEATDIRLPAGTQPTDVIVDSTGEAWVAGNGTRTLNLLGTGGETQAFPVTEGTPWALAAGANGDVWFVCSDTPRVGVRRGSSGDFEFFDVTDVPGEATSIALGPDGDVWFLVVGKAQIARLDVGKRTVKTYQIPTPACEPRGLAIGSGDVWFLESAPTANKLGVATGVAER